MDPLTLLQILDRLTGLEDQLEEVRQRLDALEQAPPDGKPIPEQPVVTVAVSSGTQVLEQAPPLAPTPVLPPPLPVAPPVFASAPQEPELRSKRVAALLGEMESTPKPELPPDPRPEPWSESRPEPRATSPAEPENLPPQEEPWHLLLRRLDLIPPTGEGENFEIQVGTWWATRIGTLLAVIAVVFLGVYVAQFSRPWLRLAELTLASFGLTGLGLWFERRYPKYGSVIFGGGLALIFFDAFAAYAVPAVKVIDSPELGTSLQFLVAGGITACALWRSSSVIATMAVLCGYIACFFSFSAGLNNFALTAALALAGMGVYCYQLRGWTVPFILSVPLTYLLYASIFALDWLGRRRGAPPFEICMFWLLADLGIFAGADLLALRSGRMLEARTRSVLHLFSSSTAALLGFLVTNTLFHDMLSPYYFTFGAVLAGLAVYYYFIGRPDALMHGYFIKGSALVTLGLCNALGGRTRWVALGVESFVFLFSARRSGLKIVRFMMGATWLVSVLYFLTETGEQVHLARLQGAEGLSLASAGGMVSLFYIFLSALLLGWQGRWLASPAMPAVAEDGMPLPGAPEPSASVDPWLAADLVFTLSLSLVICVFGSHYFPLGYEGVCFSLLLAALAGLGLWVRHWISLATLIMPLVFAHYGFWGARLAPVQAWLDGGALVGFTLAAAVLFDRFMIWNSKELAGLKLFIMSFAHALWIISLQALLGKVFGISLYLFLAVAGSAAIAVAAVYWPVALLGEMSVGLMLLAILRLLVESVATDIYFARGQLGVADLGINLLFTLPLAWAYACAYAVWPRLGEALRRRLQADDWPAPDQWIHGFVALLVTFFVLAQSPVLHGTIPGNWGASLHPSYGADRILIWVLGDAASLVAFGLAALALVPLLRWPGFKPALIASLCLLLVAHVDFYYVGRDHLALSLGLAAITLALAILPRRLRPGLPRQEARGVQWFCGGLALLLCLWLFAGQRGELAHYTTVCWGFSAIVIFLAGLVERAKPLRIIGLAGLALCIPRVFIVDVHSALYRIAATGVLGAVVLLVAFLYNKYRAAITAWDQETQDGLP